tara:strand:- start:151 stop:417 length:267 start_codon:yes stop_codon:yes gene_type:complete
VDSIRSINDSRAEVSPNVVQKHQRIDTSNSKVTRKDGSQIGYDSEDSGESDRGWMDINTQRNEESKIKKDDQQDVKDLNSPYTSFSSQ